MLLDGRVEPIRRPRVGSIASVLAQLPEQAQELASAHTDVASLVTALKEKVDEFRLHDPQISIRIGEAIIDIGIVEGNRAHEALGYMARGDALALVERNSDAWNDLKRAETLFLQANDRVGWARTRIGLVFLSAHRSIAERTSVMATVDEAHRILRENGLVAKSLVLSSNTAIVYDLLGDHEQALTIYLQMLEEVLASDETIQRLYLGMTYANLAVTYEFLGRGTASLPARRRAIDIYERYEQWVGLMREKINIAIMLTHQGKYYATLKDLLNILSDPILENVGQKNLARRILAQCYLALGRNHNVIQIIDEELPNCLQEQDYSQAISMLLKRCAALSKLRRFNDALQTLEAVETYAAIVDAGYQLGHVHRLRAVIFLEQQRTTLAKASAMQALNCFPVMKNQYEHALVLVLLAECEIREQHFELATDLLERVTSICQQGLLPAVDYQARVLSAKLRLAMHDRPSAEASLLSAAGLVIDLQDSLIFTLRADFLERRTEAHRMISEMYLQDGRIADAFSVIERIRSPAFLTYLQDRDQFRWQKDERNVQAINELHDLREEFHRLDMERSTKRDKRRLETIGARIKLLRDQLYFQPSKREIFHTRICRRGTLCRNTFAQMSRCWCITSIKGTAMLCMALPKLCLSSTWGR